MSKLQSEKFSQFLYILKRKPGLDKLLNTDVQITKIQEEAFNVFWCFYYKEKSNYFSRNKIHPLFIYHFQKIRLFDPVLFDKFTELKNTFPEDIIVLDLIQFRYPDVFYNIYDPKTFYNFYDGPVKHAYTLTEWYEISSWSQDCDIIILYLTNKRKKANELLRELMIKKFQENGKNYSKMQIDRKVQRVKDVAMLKINQIDDAIDRVYNRPKKEIMTGFKMSLKKKTNSKKQKNSKLKQKTDRKFHIGVDISTNNFLTSYSSKISLSLKKRNFIFLIILLFFIILFFFICNKISFTYKFPFIKKKK